MVYLFEASTLGNKFRFSQGAQLFNFLESCNVYLRSSSRQARSFRDPGGLILQAGLAKGPGASLWMSLCLIPGHFRALQHVARLFEFGLQAVTYVFKGTKSHPHLARAILGIVHRSPWLCVQVELELRKGPGGRAGGRCRVSGPCLQAPRALGCLPSSLDAFCTLSLPLPGSGARFRYL